MVLIKNQPVSVPPTVSRRYPGTELVKSLWWWGGGWVPVHRLVTATVRFGCDNMDIPLRTTNHEAPVHFACAKQAKPLYRASLRFTYWYAWPVSLKLCLPLVSQNVM